MRIYSVVNFSRVVKYRELVRRQKIDELKSVEVDRVEKWEVEKFLNKEKYRNNEIFNVLEEVYGRELYIGKEGRFENVKKKVAKFEKRMSIEIRRQENLDLAKERDFGRKELPKRYTAEILYR